MEYSNNHKFVYGVVLNIGSIAYFAPISSYTKPQQDNIIIKVMNHGKMEAEGSIRFNYMIPVPERHLTYYDLKTMCPSQQRRNLIEKEYRFCVKNHSRIVKQARKTYNRVISKVDDELTKHSCDFHLLEEAYKQWLD